MSAHFAALTWCWSCSSRWTPEWAADTSPVRRRGRKLQNNISTSSPPWWARAPPGWMRCTLRLRGGTAVCVHAENKITTTEKQKDLQIISRSSAFGPNKLRSEHLHTKKNREKKKSARLVHSGRSALEIHHPSEKIEIPLRKKSQHPTAAGWGIPRSAGAGGGGGGRQTVGDSSTKMEQWGRMVEMNKMSGCVDERNQRSWDGGSHSKQVRKERK